MAADQVVERTIGGATGAKVRGTHGVHRRTHLEYTVCEDVGIVGERCIGDSTATPSFTA